MNPMKREEVFPPQLWLLELSPPTEGMIRAKEALAKVARKNPEAVGEYLAEKWAKGEMWNREIEEFLQRLGV